MSEEQIVTSIKELLNDNYGFDVYIAMKNDEQFIKRFVLEEGRPEENHGFKARIRDSIVEVITNTFLADDSQYASVGDLANEQERFYVIKQDEEYYPFHFLTIPDEEIHNFRLDDKENADAILFKFMIQRNGQKRMLWAYQKIQPSSIPNKKKNYFQLRVKSYENPDIFEELTDQMFIITKNIDLLIWNDDIITNKIKLMERHFGLETFVRSSASRAVELIKQVDLIENDEKLQEYVQRSNKKYAKKMLQIHKYPVTSMDKDNLIERINTVERWKNVFEIQNDQVHIRNFSDVEHVIDLFTERYTKSEITNQEYDTSVKEKAGPI